MNKDFFDLFDRYINAKLNVLNWVARTDEAETNQADIDYLKKEMRSAFASAVSQHSRRPGI